MTRPTANQMRDRFSATAVKAAGIALGLIGSSLLGFGGMRSASAQQTFQQAILDAHNVQRDRVGVSSLIWSDELADYAQRCAQLRMSQGANLEHCGYGDSGENMFWASGRQWTPDAVVNNWAEEAADYDYSTNRCRGVCGHYTQVVWADTTEVGCAVVRSSREEMWVCNYNPPGNYVGQRPY